MLNDYVVDGDNAWLLPNLAFGGEAWAVVHLRVPSRLLADANPSSARPWRANWLRQRPP